MAVSHMRNEKYAIKPQFLAKRYLKSMQILSNHRVFLVGGK